MTKSILRAPLLSFVAIAFCVLVCPPGADAALIPLRTGTIISKTDVGNLSYIKAVDEAGKQFWVLTQICAAGENGKIEVLAGAHYDKVISDHLDATIEDLYAAQLLKIDDREIVGFGALGLPAGCSMSK